MCYCVITQKAGIKYRTGTSQTCTLLLATMWSQNVYYIQLLNTDKPDPPKVVNQHQLFDLNHTSPPSEATSPNGDFAVIPSFLQAKSISNLHNLNTTNILPYHHYNTRSKHKAATTVRQAEVNTIITHL